MATADNQKNRAAYTREGRRQLFAVLQSARGSSGDLTPDSAYYFKSYVLNTVLEILCASWIQYLLLFIQHGSNFIDSGLFKCFSFFLNECFCICLIWWISVASQLHVLTQAMQHIFF